MNQKITKDDTQTICLHHNDSDGRACGAIVRRALGAEVWLYEMDYGDSVPLERILTSDHIIIVDFSLPRSEMEKLAAYHQLTWIDHHKSSLEEMKGLSESWPGVRDINEAACVLTWGYFYPDQPIPRAVTLIGDRDIWRWAEADTGAFNEGLYQLDTRAYNERLWGPLLDDDADTLAKIIENGKVLRDARLRDIRRTLLRWGFPVRFEDHRTLAVNIRGSGDIGQQIRNMGYEIAYCYVDNLQNGELITFVTLYSDEVDVSKIAQRFGGGGHSGAAGFHFKRGGSPFPDGMEVEIEKYD
jgi:oligoribonuclease NrnB/cAMP/cGMP phosphodiesterase (DHH superfamily)